MKFSIISFLSLLFFNLLFGPLCYGQDVNDKYKNYYKILNPQDDHDLISAYLFYESIIENDLLNKDTITAIQDLRMLSIAEYNLGLLNQSEISAVRALYLIDKIKLNKTLIESKRGLYTQLGMIYKTQNNYTKALDYYDRALNFANNAIDSASIINNIAIIHRDQKKYRLAIDELENVYHKMLTISDTIKLARALDNLGYVQSKLNKQKGLSNMLEALQMRLKLNDTRGLFSSYRHLTLFYWNNKNKNLSIENAQKCYDIAQILNSPSYLQESLSLFVLIDNNPKISQYKRITDSITKAEKVKLNRFASMKYDQDKEIQKTEEAKLQAEKQKLWKLIYLGLGTLGLIGSIFLYFILKNRHNKRISEQVNNTEARISEKIHDEVANDIYNVMTQLQKDPRDKSNLIDDLDRIYLRTRDISRANSAISDKKDFNKLLLDLLASYKTTNVNVITQNYSKINWERISNIKKTVIYRVLQELMTNMRKHSQASVVVLRFEQKPKGISITYSDNGIGCELKIQNGLLNAENRIHNINGTITFESDINKGFKAYINV